MVAYFSDGRNTLREKFMDSLNLYQYIETI